MPLDDGVSLHVAQVHLDALPQHVGVLPLHEPADVREEEAPLDVVRVGVRLRELVVHAVVADPLQDRVLSRNSCLSQRLGTSRIFVMIVTCPAME